MARTNALHVPGVQALQQGLSARPPVAKVRCKACASDARFAGTDAAPIVGARKSRCSDLACAWHCSAETMSIVGSTEGATIRSAPSVPHVRAPRLLIPKEHGAYFQLAAPLMTAIAMGRPSSSSFLFALSAVAAFLSHESFLVLIGGRGGRARREDGARAVRWLAVLVALALACAAAAWAMAPALGVLPLLPVGMAALVGALVVYRLERTMIGEILVGAALASAALPVAWAAGVSPAHVWTAWLSWGVAAAAGTCAVRSITLSHREPSPTTRFARLVTIVLTAAGIALRWPWATLAAAPTVILAIFWIVAPPNPRRLRQVGWTLAAATLTGSVILVALVRCARDSHPGPPSSAAGPSFDIRCLQSKGETR
jgi:hypothetical protein